ncbi:MAG: metallophosphoesterase family protein [Minicystis sp.]
MTIERIGLLGDIHAEDDALAVALRVLRDEGAERIVAVGDIVDGLGSVDRCCALLVEAGAVAVRGNHERWFLAGTMRELPHATMAVGAEARRFLAGLPATVRIEAEGGDILVCHGLGDDDMASVDLRMDPSWMRPNPPLEALLDEERPLRVLNGHTHQRGVWCYGKLAVVNGGTLFRKHEPCFGVVDLGRGEVRYHVIEGGRVGRVEVVPLPPARGGR